MIHEFSKVNAFGMGVAGSLRGKLTSSVRNCGTLWGGYVPIRVNYFWVALSKFITSCSPYLKNGELRTIRAHFRRCNGISKLCIQACMFQYISKLFCCTVQLYYNLKLWNLHVDSLNITTGVIKKKKFYKVEIHCPNLSPFHSIFMVRRSEIICGSFPRPGIICGPDWDFRVPVEISLVYWQYKAMNFSLHYRIKYFKNNNCFPSILNIFFS